MHQTDIGLFNIKQRTLKSISKQLPLIKSAVIGVAMTIAHWLGKMSTKEFITKYQDILATPVCLNRSDLCFSCEHASMFLKLSNFT